MTMMTTLSQGSPMRGVVTGMACVGLVLGWARVGEAQERVRTPEASYQAPAATRGAGPNGATMRCKDGSHPAATAPATACDARGGVLARYPLVATPAAPPRGAETVIPVPAAARPRDGARVRGATTTSPAASTTPPAETPGPRRAVRPPADATLLCGDGTFVRADTASARCAAHGGVKLRFLKRGTS
jgi:hypothetical protein